LWIRPGWLRWRPVLLCLRPSRFTTAVPLRPHEECVMTTELIRRQEKRGTAASWTSANPTLLAGEWGIETDTGRTKLGDGATAWNDLAYRDEQLAAMAGFTGTYAPLAFSASPMDAGRYYPGAGVLTTAVIPAEGRLHVTRLNVARTTTINRLAVNCTVVGTTGAVVRLGVYAHNAST